MSAANVSYSDLLAGKTSKEKKTLDTYVIVKQRQSAVTVYEPTPHAVVPSLKEAKRECDKLNNRAAQNLYWYKKVPNTIPCE